MASSRKEARRGASINALYTLAQIRGTGMAAYLSEEPSNATQAFITRWWVRRRAHQSQQATDADYRVANHRRAAGLAMRCGTEQI